MSRINDKIELILPFKADYVSVARLSASGIAVRAGFDIETIEDIKVAVSEVCNKLLEIGSIQAEYYKITFLISDCRLNITFSCEDPTIECIFGDRDEAFGVSIIKALMDNVELCPHGSYMLSMSKSLERIV